MEKERKPKYTQVEIAVSVNDKAMESALVTLVFLKLERR